MKLYLKIIYIVFILVSNICSSQSETRFFLKKVDVLRDLNKEKNYTEITYNIFDLNIDEKSSVQLVSVNNAFDDKDNELIPIIKNPAYSQNYELKIKMTTPGRGAKFIKKITGTYEFFNPTKQNGGLISSPLSSAKHGTVLYKKNNTYLKFIDKEHFKKIVKENKNIFSQKIDSILKNKELKTEEIELIKNMGDWMFSKLNSSDKIQILFEKKDPTKIIKEINIYNSKGVKQNNGYSSTSKVTMLQLNQNIENDWTIELVLKNENASQIIPFEFNNIFLP